MRVNFLTSFRTSLALLCIAAAYLTSCNDGGDIASVGVKDEGENSSDSKKTDHSAKGDDDDDTKGDKSNGDDIDLDNEITAVNIAGFNTPGSTEDNGDGSAIEYPNMDFLGNGITTCKSDTYPTKVQFFSKLFPDKLELNMYQASIKADKGKAEDQANQEIMKNTGITRYVRPSKVEKVKATARGVKFATYAIFAKSVSKENQGTTFNFSEPLPVFPWPAPPSRYESLEKDGSQSWTAQITGSDTFTVTVTITYLGSTGDESRIKFQTEIAEDQPGSPNYRARYEAFPMPREAIYTVNGKTRDVRQIESTNWFNGEQCGNRPEQVNVTYKMCRKSTSLKDEQFPCQ